MGGGEEVEGRGMDGCSDKRLMTSINDYDEWTLVSQHVDVG